MSGKEPDRRWLYLLNRQRKARLDAAGLRENLVKALDESGLTFRRLGVILVSDDRIRDYNRRFLGHDYATDVLSFALGRGEGEIIVSAETARRQAEEYGHPLEYELLLLCVHGALHLSGWDDARPADRRRMAARMRRIARRAAG